MPLATGTKLGPYEIVAPLGAGGMGEVYRAKDTRLGREVAVKVLPQHLSSNPEIRARFEREAKTVSSLNHPYVCTLHDIGREGDTDFLVMELMEGETLAARLQKGALPLPDVLKFGTQIAEALDRAHRAGVLHRDLKPGNIMLTRSGAKLMDFGLARATGLGAVSDLTSSPTVAGPLTAEGTILGTFQYMAPEQLEGQEADARADLWALGCVLYEMATGKRAFDGKSQASLISSIMKEEPRPIAELVAMSPPALDRVVRACLAKDADERIQTAHDVKLQLQWIADAGSQAGVPVPVSQRRKSRERLAWILVGATTLALVAIAAIGLPAMMRRPAPASPARFEVPPPKEYRLPNGLGGTASAISPDGRLIAMIATDSAGSSRLWVRRLGELTPRELPGTEGVTEAFWSPDSRWLAFVAHDQVLSKIAVDGGTPERICDTKAARGGSWGRDGTILLAPYSNGGIFRVSSSGGTPVEVTRPDSAHGVTGHRYPVLLPDAKHFLFMTVPAGPDGKLGLCVGAVDGGPTREIARVESGVAWAGSGWLLTTRNAALAAWRFDERRLAVVGDPVAIGDPVVGTNRVGASVVSVSQDGTLAYLTRDDVPSRAEWYDLVKQQPIGTSPLAPGLYAWIKLAPDDRRALVLQRTDPSRSDVLLVELDRGIASRLTQPPESGDVESPGAWSNDGTRVAYLEGTTQSIRLRSLVDGSQQTFLADDRAFKRVGGFAPDGRSLLYSRLDPATKWDVWLLPLDGGTPKVLLNTPAHEVAGEISPDGRWLSFRSDESGFNEAYIAPFATPGLKYQVTIGGGGGGFSRDGKRFYFVQVKEPNVIRVADIRGESTLSLGPSELAFRLPDDPGIWARAHDEPRIIRLVPTEKPAPQAVTILQHWESALRKP